MNKNTVSPFLNVTNYGYSKYDFLMSKDDNIGFNAENLTIVVLSFNRSDATIKLLKSIEKKVLSFRGKIIIADNGSVKSELNKINDYIKKSKLDIKIVCFDKNYGVAGGRNRIIDYVETDWIMNLDNDIYFISDPISTIQKTISLLGVRFLNIPLISEDKKTVFSNGGSLYVDYNFGEYTIGGGSMFEQISVKDVDELVPTLSTFLLGGASVLNKKEFIRCGMFDDNMFIGFEDIDFSITLFNEGMKIGNCPIFSLIHDHSINSDKASLEYEKTRFSHGILKESAEYFEKKNNFKVWNANIETWILQRQKDLKILDSNITNEIFSNDMPKIALIVDVKNWCFWNISCRIKEHLGKYYKIDIIPLEELNNNIIKALLFTKEYDLTHIFWRGHLSLIESQKDYIETCGLSYEGFLDLYIKNHNITTAVYDHLYLDDLNFTNSVLTKCKSYYVSSKKLKGIYDENKEILLKPQMVVTDGVDLDHFQPQHLERFKKHKKLVIGWVGNSAWSKEIEDFKGFNTIIKPALDELIKEGYPIECDFADRQEKMIPYEKMPDYYAKIDVCLCASKCEGTPNPVLESMACGVPIITTDVGIVMDAFGKRQQNFVIARDKELFKKKIIELVNNRSLLDELSKENLQQIKKWDWKIIMKNFKSFFDLNLKNDKNN